ncbi:MAG: bifunctional phosphopantothenoylcysteine decarboxylase/phosphopantothenate--cysteine ligase CoaBC, partial [Selenomonadaceae bacterium]|nr:bifunctional phosphopantothenoylcysteine decarboxylase/phosphopantothenate--cysteine ligase CoaBC [Selenomonadaceae bacterium]
GRLPEPEEICAAVEKFFAPKILVGKKILVTAGGTIEAIDPVRYIGNRSSGRMGYEIAKSAANHGAEVVLISGKSELEPPDGLKFLKVESAVEMREKVLSEFDSVDAVIMSAAVADYRVKNISEQKIKKSAENLTLELVKNPDILRELGGLKKSQVLVGFAAETQNILDYANKKLVEKNLDFIVANDVTAEGAGFGVTTNIASIIWRGGKIETFPKMTKADLSEKIIERVADLLK